MTVGTREKEYWYCVQYIVVVRCVLICAIAGYSLVMILERRVFFRQGSFSRLTYSTVQIVKIARNDMKTDFREM